MTGHLQQTHSMQLGQMLLCCKYVLVVVALGINFVFQPPPNVGNWTGMLVSGNQTVPSGISLASAQLLFDSAQVCCMHYCGQ